MEPVIEILPFTDVIRVPASETSTPSFASTLPAVPLIAIVADPVEVTSEPPPISTPSSAPEVPVINIAPVLLVMSEGVPVASLSRSTPSEVLPSVAIPLMEIVPEPVDRIVDESTKTPSALPVAPAPPRPVSEIAPLSV